MGHYWVYNWVTLKGDKTEYDLARGPNYHTSPAEPKRGGGAELLQCWILLWHGGISIIVSLLQASSGIFRSAIGAELPQKLMSVSYFWKSHLPVSLGVWISLKIWPFVPKAPFENGTLAPKLHKVRYITATLVISIPESGPIGIYKSPCSWVPKPCRCLNSHSTYIFEVNVASIPMFLPLGTSMLKPQRDAQIREI